ncbi:MAG TPA: hypothetical protein ENG01_00325, partial [Candidatus Aenigmarchaeota archaeon]|nr:hypothetical protein [Candidatus Aenigmarchaeota archaeon]HEX32842.1 hypothetical protein [Candidatus Aenigmarchaeota archaeon]
MRKLSTSLKLRRPPNAAANTIKKIKNLFATIRPSTTVNLHFSFQLNGPPHLGTLFSLTSLFAIAQMLEEKGLKPKIFINILENAPAKIFTISNRKYAINFSHLRVNGEPLIKRYLKPYQFIFELLAKSTNIKQSSLLWYSELQATPAFRKRLIYMLEHYESFSKVLSPYDNRLKIRIPCPHCGLLSKDSKAIKIKKLGTNKYLLSSNCPYHGVHTTLLSTTNKDLVDVNTIIRNVIKESIFIEKAQSTGAANAMIEGSDWMYIVPLIEKGLGLLGHNVLEFPIRVFTPLVVDKTGAKLSKHIHVKGGYPEYSDFINHIGEEPWKF